jgi:hypothetical protein
MTIVEQLSNHLRSCEDGACTQVGFRIFLMNEICPRLRSYQIFIQQINDLPVGHSLRRDLTVLEIISDHAELDRLMKLSEEFLAV